MDEATASQRFPTLRIAVGTVAFLAGALLVLLATAVGHCSAFGGRCPAEPVPVWDDDVFGMSFLGAVIAIGVPVWLARPGWQRVAYAAATGVPAALLIALLARDVAAG